MRLFRLIGGWIDRGIRFMISLVCTSLNVRLEISRGDANDARSEAEVGSTPAISPTSHRWYYSSTISSVQGIDSKSKKNWVVKWTDSQFSKPDSIDHVGKFVINLKMITSSFSFTFCKVGWKMKKDDTFKLGFENCVFEMHFVTFTSELRSQNPIKMYTTLNNYLSKCSHLDTSTKSLKFCEKDLKVPAAFDCLMIPNTEISAYMLPRANHTGSFINPGFDSLDDIIKQIAEGQPPAPQVCMQYELLRVCSLRNFPKENKPWITSLASAGFYYADNEDEVICYCCGLRRKSWISTDVPEKIHKTTNPDCKFLTRNSEFNVPVRNSGTTRNLDRLDKILEGLQDEDGGNVGQSSNPSSNLPTENNPPKYPQYANKQHRQATFTGWPPGLSQTPKQLAEAGSYYAGFGDCVRCFYCGIGTGNARPHIHNRITTGGTESENTNARDLDKASVIPGMSESSSATHQIGPSNSPENGDRDPHLVKVDNPKHQRYSTLDSRTNSFISRWPRHLDQTPRQMAEAGFFYAGVEDYTRCFACGGGLRNWEPAPSRDCTHKDPLDAHIAAVLRKMEFDNERIKEAIMAVRIDTGRTSINAEQVLLWILDQDYITSESAVSSKEEASRFPRNETYQEQEVMGEILEQEQQLSGESSDEPVSDGDLEENAALKENITCKICFKKGLSIVFLPCRHLMACEDCAALTNRDSTCPICRQKIKGTVKVYFSGGREVVLPAERTVRENNARNNACQNNIEEGAIGGRPKAADWVNDNQAKQHATSTDGQAGFEEPTEDDKNEVHQQPDDNRQGETTGAIPKSKGTKPRHSSTKSNKKRQSRRKRKRNNQRKGGKQIEKPVTDSGSDSENIDAATILKTEIGKLKKMFKCQICLENPTNVVFFPCGHQAACTSCAESAQTCPRCGKPVKKFCQVETGLK